MKDANSNSTTTDFRLRAVTFDNVPWVITMKKNEHYFPTTEWTKDPSEPCGWRRTTYEDDGRIVAGEPTEGVILGAMIAEDGGAVEMDEEGGGAAAAAV